MEFTQNDQNWMDFFCDIFSEEKNTTAGSCICFMSESVLQALRNVQKRKK